MSSAICTLWVLAALGAEPAVDSSSTWASTHAPVVEHSAACCGGGLPGTAYGHYGVSVWRSVHGPKAICPACRYSALNTYVYRRPYDYRTQFDYPWRDPVCRTCQCAAYRFGIPSSHAMLAPTLQGDSEMEPLRVPQRPSAIREVR